MFLTAVMFIKPTKATLNTCRIPDETERTCRSILLIMFAALNPTSRLAARHTEHQLPMCVCVCKHTRIMRRIAAIPDVAITLALLGTRLSNVGMMFSAP